jgi:phosphatidylglycerol lysyltransferase
MGVYEAYINVQEPRFDQARLRAMVGDEAVDAVKPATVERLRFLFGSYLEQRLEASVQAVTVDVAERLVHVQRHGQGALAYSSLRPGILALPLKGEGEGYVPFAIKGRTAAMVGDPVCAPAALPVAVDTFLFHCARNRLSPVAVQVTRPVADIVARRGGHSNRMGDEAEVHLGRHDTQFNGGRFERLRRMRNLATRHRICVREATYEDVPHDVVARVSADWLETKLNKRELDLLLRPLPDRDEPDVRKFFAFQCEELVGFVIFNPLFEQDRTIGYYSDLERYRRSPGGIRDHIISEAARAFLAEGREVLSLGLAPLWNLDEDDHPAACPKVRELLVRIRDEVAPIYNFEGVSRHKAYYCPTWKPTYFCSLNGAATTDMLNVFSMIGLLPPEALKTLGDATLDMVHGA